VTLTAEDQPRHARHRRDNGYQRLCRQGRHGTRVKPRDSRAGRARLTVRSAILKPYWGKPAVRNFRGANGNGATGMLHGHEAGNGGHRQARPYAPPRRGSTYHLRPRCCSPRCRAARVRHARTFPSTWRAVAHARGAFARGSGHGLLELGAAEVGTVLPPDLSYCRDFAARPVMAICTQPDLDTPCADSGAPAHRTRSARGRCTGDDRRRVHHELGSRGRRGFSIRLAESKASVQAFLQRKSPAWHLVGGVHFTVHETYLV
jgi:hypothetical protein